MDMPACHIQLIHVGREIDTDETARYMFEGKFPLVCLHGDRKRTVRPCLRDFRACFDFFKVAIYAAKADIILSLTNASCIERLLQRRKIRGTDRESVVLFQKRSDGKRGAVFFLRDLHMAIFERPIADAI